MRPVGNLVALASLYLVQGIVAGVGVVLVQVVEAAGGSLEEQTRLLAWGGLPWVLKLAWGVGLDRWLPPGSTAFRRVLVTAQLLTAAGLWWVAQRAGTPTAGLGAAWFTLNALASLQDVAADAFAIDAVEPRRRGLANAIMAGARALGAGFIGTMLIAKLMGVHGLDGALVLVSGACGLAALPLLVACPPDRRAQAPIEWGELSRSWLEGTFASGLVLGFIVLLADAITGAVSWQFLSTHGGWNPAEALEQLSPTAAVAELVGFALAAVVIDRVGPRTIIIVASIVLGGTWACFGLLSGSWSNHDVVLGLSIVEGLTRAFVIAGAYAALMNATAPRLRATHFVVFMAMINLGRVLGPLVAPRLVAALGFGGLYVLAGGLQISVAAIAARLDLGEDSA